MKLLEFEEETVASRPYKGRYGKDVGVLIAHLPKQPVEKLVRGAMVAEFTFVEYGQRAAQKEASTFRQALAKAATGFAVRTRTSSSRVLVSMFLVDAEAAAPLLKS